MNRKHFVVVVLAAAAGLGPAVVRAAQPCPPPVVSVVGGTSAATTCSSASAIYSTTFSSVENPISQGGIWVNGKANGASWNNVQTNGAGAYATAIPTPGHYDDSIAHLAASFNSNQYAQGTVRRVAGYGVGHEIELLVRFNITSKSATGYEVYWSTNNGINIVRWNGPLDSFTPLTAVGGFNATEGDVLRVEAVGSTITVYVNGSAVLTATDSTYTNGHPGVGFMPWGDGAVLTNFGWKSFEAGNL